MLLRILHPRIAVSNSVVLSTAAHRYQLLAKKRTSAVAIRAPLPLGSSAPERGAALTSKGHHHWALPDYCYQTFGRLRIEGRGDRLTPVDGKGIGTFDHAFDMDTEGSLGAGKGGELILIPDQFGGSGEV